MKKKKSVLKGIKNFFETIILGKSKEQKFTDRLVILTNLIMICFGVVALVANISLGLGIILIILSGAISVIYAFYYLIGLHKGYSERTYLLISITYLILINFGWFFNYGSKGPVLSLFIVLCAFFVYMWGKRSTLYFLAILFLNVLILFLLEWHYPNLVGRYTDEHTRLGDTYLGLFIALILITSFSMTVKLNYIREYEEARKADQLKSAFLANMSHEIRTPLNAIIGFSSIITDADFENDQKDEFKKLINQNSDYLLALIEDIIDLSKIEIDELNFKFTRFDVYDMFEKLKLSFLKSLDEKSKEVDIRYEKTEPVQLIETDSVRLEQVLRNLISNSIKFTSKGFVEFGVKKENAVLTFYVKDTGIGIRPENQEKIFDRFVKVEDDQKQYFRGTGIGLFLCQKIIHKLNGHIWVESVYGEGSTFYFTIDE